MRRLIALLIIMMIVFLAMPVFAGVPHFMQFQGKVADKSDKPLGGSHKLTFRIYEQESGGSPIWSETHNDTEVENGVFSVLLGGINSLDIAFDNPYWISIEIGTTDGTEEMPRQMISSTAYAYRAEKADWAETAAKAIEASRLSTKEEGFDPTTLALGEMWFEPAVTWTSDAKLLLHFDGTNGAKLLTGSSPKKHTDITFKGNAHLATSETKWGPTSVYLNGNEDRLELDDSPDWDICGSTTDSWTIDFWVKHTVHSGTETYVGQYISSSNRWHIYRSDSGGISFSVDIGGGGIEIRLYSGVDINDSQWHHIALVKVGDDWALYLDGDQIGQALNKNFTGTLNHELWIGAVVNYRGEPCNQHRGHMDELRIVNANAFGADPLDSGDKIKLPQGAYECHNGQVKFYDGNKIVAISADIN